jgi:hypothetical protein
VSRGYGMRQATIPSLKKQATVGASPRGEQNEIGF